MVVDNSVLTVKKVELDVPDLNRNLNCVVRVKQLSEDDLKLWKPMPKSLAVSEPEDSCDSAEKNNTHHRRNPLHRAKDRVDYVGCLPPSDEADSDGEQSEPSLDDSFEPVNKRPKAQIISLREPSKSRLEAQQQIAMRKAALALLKLRNSSGGGGGIADNDLSQTGITQKTDYALEYEQLSRMIKPMETLSDDLEANPSHNTSELEHVELQTPPLPVITSTKMVNKELRAITGDNV